MSIRDWWEKLGQPSDLMQHIERGANQKMYDSISALSFYHRSTDQIEKDKYETHRKALVNGIGLLLVDKNQVSKIEFDLQLQKVLKSHAAFMDIGRNKMKESEAGTIVITKYYEDLAKLKLMVFAEPDFAPETIESMFHEYMKEEAERAK